MLPDGLASQSESLKPEIFQNLTLKSGNADVAMVLYFFSFKSTNTAFWAPG